VRERTLEAAPRLDRRTDDDELRPALVRDARDLVPEQTGASADDLAPHSDSVRRRDRRGGIEPVSECAQLVVEACVEGQLPIDEERRDENDPRAAVRGEPARESEGVLRLLPLEQRHDDRAVGDRPGPPRQPPRAAVEEPDVGQAESHLTSGYGTEASRTFGSTRSRRLT